MKARMTPILVDSCEAYLMNFELDKRLLFSVTKTYEQMKFERNKNLHEFVMCKSCGKELKRKDTRIIIKGDEAEIVCFSCHYNIIHHKKVS